jgi:uncharacterized protein YfaS (alpha-2-macroglobulin family)
MVDGRWRTTQENGTALRAIARYMQYQTANQQPFSGYVSQENKKQPIDSASTTSPLPLKPEMPFVLHNDGPGIMYANWNWQGIPADVIQPDRDANISIRRSYCDRRGHAINPESIVQGTLVAVRLQINTLGRSLDHLVIEDLLPAGFEIENARLKTSQLLPWAKRKNTLPVRHLESRDDRLIIFTDKLSGHYTFYYAMRAITPGRYTKPPVMISAMYDPDISSIHDGGNVAVVPHDQ